MKGGRTETELIKPILLINVIINEVRALIGRGQEHCKVCRRLGFSVWSFGPEGCGETAEKYMR